MTTDNAEDLKIDQAPIPLFDAMTLPYQERQAYYREQYGKMLSLWAAVLHVGADDARGKITGSGGYNRSTRKGMSVCGKEWVRHGRGVDLLCEFVGIDPDKFRAGALAMPDYCAIRSGCKPRKPAKKPVGWRPKASARSDQIMAILRAHPAGLSRQQIADLSGLTVHQVRHSIDITGKDYVERVNVGYGPDFVTIYRAGRK